MTLVLPLQSSEQKVACFCSKSKSLLAHLQYYSRYMRLHKQLIFLDFTQECQIPSITILRRHRSQIRQERLQFENTSRTIVLSFTVLHFMKEKHQGYKLPQKLQEGKHFQQSFAPNPRSITQPLS